LFFYLCYSVFLTCRRVDDKIIFDNHFILSFETLPKKEAYYYIA
jgi:hypothetical protein